jgi:hypothetical protein
MNLTYFIILFFIITPFSPQFRGIQLVVTVLSHRCNSCKDLGEAKVESRASSEKTPYTWLASARWEKHIPAGQTLP